MKCPHRLPTCVLVFCAAAVPAAGQLRHGQLAGRVTDAFGVPQAGVRVSLQGEAPSWFRATSTDAAGAYRVARLEAGRYRVTFVSTSGSTTRSLVTVHAGLLTRLDGVLPSPDSAAVLLPRHGEPDPGVDEGRRVALTVAAVGPLHDLPMQQDVSGLFPAVPGITTPAPASGGRGGRLPSFYLAGTSAEAWSLDGLLALVSPPPAGCGSVEPRCGRQGAGEEAWPRWLPTSAVLEAHVQPSAGNASVQSAGIDISLVTRSGTNRFQGSLSASLSDRRLQSDNMTSALRAQGAGAGTPIRQISEIALEAGGPIRRDKAWWHASVTRSKSDVGIVRFYVARCLNPDQSPVAGADARPDCLNGDVTTVGTIDAKGQFQWHPRHRATVFWARTDKRKPNRGASPFVRLEATSRQRELGLARPLQLRHESQFGNRLSVDAGIGYSDASFVLDWQRPDLAAVQPAYDRYTLVNWRSGTRHEYWRPATTASVTGSYFGSGPGGDHSVTFGVERRWARDGRHDQTGGGAVAVFDSRSGRTLAYQARVVRDGLIDLASTRWSAYVQDSYRRGRFTADAGIRFDWQDDEALPTTVPPSAILPELLPAVLFPGADSGVVYRDWSPRFALACDLGPGRGRGSVVTVSVGRYAGSGNATSGVLQPTGQTRLTWWWSDANGDGSVARDELDLPRGQAAAPSPNYDPAAPDRVRGPASVDPGLKNDRTDEFTVGIARRFGRTVNVHGTYVWRRYYRLQDVFPVEADGSLVPSSSFVPVTWTATGCVPGAECPPVTYYQRSARLPVTRVRRNVGQYRRHQGVDVVVRKRLSHGWSMSATLAWNRGQHFFPAPTHDYTDPTNIAMWNGFAYSSLEARWTARLSGTFLLPARFSVSTVLAVREGFPFNRVVTSPNRGALGPTAVYLKPFGAERYPAVRSLDVRLDRVSRWGRLRIEPGLSIFNALNANTVLSRNRVQNSQSANQVDDILPPRFVRLHLALAW